MCQINTEHMRQEIGCIDVNVPPDIDMSKTSSDNAVQVNIDIPLPHTGEDAEHDTHTSLSNIPG